MANDFFFEEQLSFLDDVPAEITKNYFYNTTHLSGPELKEALAKAEKQEDFVLAVFRAERKLTPSQVYRYVARRGINWPLTSVRRAIDTLTKNHVLEKLTEKQVGMYGSKEHFWQIR